jgi:flagellar protein FliS
LTQAGPNPYLRTKILTASPEQLRLMLYEGAIRFCRQGAAAIEAKDWEGSYNNLMRAQKIVLELSTSLNHNMAPELCAKLSGLYTYIYRRLVEANVQRSAALVREALQLLEYERETWQMAMERQGAQGRGPAGGNGGVAAADHAGVAAPQQTAMSSLSRLVG